MIRALANARGGGVGIMVAAAMPVLIGAAALAVDVGTATLETRQLQGAADAAAMAAAADPTRSTALAGDSVAGAHWPASVTTTATAGRYAADPSVAPANRFLAGAAPANAVRVRLVTQAPTFFARIFGFRTIPLARTATAAQVNLASFSLGSRLAALNGGVINSYLSALTGSSVSLSVMDYSALASGNVDLFSLIGALRTTAGISAGSYSSALGTQVTAGQVLSAAALVAQQSGNVTAAAALSVLAARSNGQTLKLSSLIDAGLLGGQDTAAAGTANVNLLDLVTTTLQTAGPKRQVALDLGATIPGLAATKVTIAIGERTEQSPWLAVTADGTPVLRTAQTRIYAQITIAGVSLPGVGSLVSINLPLFVELASAQARLKGITCASDATRGVTIEAKPGAGTLAIGTVDTGKLQDFTTPIAITQARLVHALLVDVDGSAKVDLGAAEHWQSLFFTAARIAAADVQTASSGAAVQGLAESLVRTVSLKATVGGLVPLPAGPIVSAVGSQLAIAAPALDTLIDLVTGTVGVHYGQADVRVTGMRCGTTSLVG